jgi:urea-proton symporter
VLTITEIGFDSMHQSVLEERPELLNLLMPAAIMFLFNNLLFGIGEIFHSNVWWSRAFAFRENVGFKAYMIAGIVWAPIPIVAGFIALAVPSMGLNVPAADMVGPMVAAKLLGFTGAVIVFIVVFSSLASSLDSLLAATSDLILQDIYRGHINPDASDERLRIMAKRIILLLGVITWLICLPRITTLGSLLQYLGAFVASTIWPIIAGLYWKRANANGALLAMVMGTVTGIWAYFAVGFYVAALVSAAVSMLIVVTSTWLMPATFDWERLAAGTGGSRE